jgi:PAS domain S-box-containing protein
MKSAKIPKEEKQRLQALREYAILDTLPEEQFDDLTLLASQICKAPIALISLVDESRQWFKSKVGLEATETPRNIAFCAHAILGHDLFIVPDSLQDKRFRDNPLVVQEPKVRFYAGAPLETHAGFLLGTLCVIDHIPRTLQPEQIRSLQAIARQVVSQMELRLALKREAENRIQIASREEELRSIFEYVPIGLSKVNSRFEFIQANAAYLKWIGYSMEELRGKNIFDVTHPEDLPKTREATLKYSDPNYSVYRFQKRYITKEGEVVWGQVTSHQHWVQASKDYFIFSTIEDITDRKELEKKSQRREKELNHFFEVSQDLLCFAGTDGYFKKVNRSFQNILGFTPEELLARPFFEFIHPDDLASTEKEVEKLSRGIATVSFQNRYLMKSGNYVTISWSATPSIDGTIYAIGRDVTKEIEMEKSLIDAKEKAESAASAKSRFLANLSHEIRTPINGVVGMTELMLGSESDPEKREKLQVIHDSGNILLALINDTLDFSKIEAGKIEIENLPFNFHQSCQEVIRLFQIKVQEKRIQLSIEMDATVPEWIYGDVTRIRQILMNLLGNAIKFTEKGSVSISSKGFEVSDGAYKIVVLIQDTGIGISEENQKKLFQSFTQADASTTRRFGGTGLGLVICKALCEMMGGDIWVESEIGMGSKVFFSFIARKAEQPHDQQMNERSRQDLKKFDLNRALRILVAEDNDVNQMVLVGFLERLGYSADRAINGKEVLMKMSKAPYDLIFMDCNMPEMDGYDTTRNIRKKYHGEKSPRIVAVTASVSQEQMEHCFSSGMDAFIRKPITESEIVRVITDLFIPDLMTPAIQIRTQERNSISNDSEEIFDWKAFGENTLGIEHLLPEMIRQFESQADETLEAIRNGIEVQDANALRVAAHTLKGMAAQFYADRVKDLALQLELKGFNSELKGCDELFQVLKCEVKDLSQQLKKYENSKR